MATGAPTPTRIHVIGNTCAGKSTLAARLGSRLGLPVVDLDALNWLPCWVALTDTDPARFDQRVQEATAGEAWVVAGSYSRVSRRLLWPRVQLMVWLDPPLPTVVLRVLRRSWRRYRTRELLWGTNVERFWPQLKVWHPDSLVRWAVTQHARKRRDLEALMAEPAMAHVRFARLRRADEVERFVEGLPPPADPTRGAARYDRPA